MTIEKLKNSKFAKWEKKKIKVWDSTVLIFEAILDETIDSNLHHENDTLTLNNSDTIEAQQINDVSVSVELNTTTINTNSLSNSEIKNSLDAHETIIETGTDSKDDE